MSLKPGEIVYCNITASGKKLYKAEKVTLSAPYSGYEPKLYISNVEHSLILKKMSCIEKTVNITHLEILHRCGFKTNSKEFTEVKASDEKRNKITGAYE